MTETYTTFLVVHVATVAEMDEYLSSDAKIIKIPALYDALVTNSRLFFDPGLCVVFVVPNGQKQTYPVDATFYNLLRIRRQLHEIPADRQACGVRIATPSEIVHLASLGTDRNRATVHFLTLDATLPLQEPDLRRILYDVESRKPATSYVPRVANKLTDINPFYFWVILANVWRLTSSISFFATLLYPLFWLLGRTKYGWLMDATLIPSIKRLNYSQTTPLASQGIDAFPSMQTFEDLMRPNEGCYQSAMLANTQVTIAPRRGRLSMPLPQLILATVDFLLLFAFGFVIARMLIGLFLTWLVSATRYDARIIPMTLLGEGKRIVLEGGTVLPHSIIGFNLLLTYLFLAWYVVRYWNKHVRGTRVEPLYWRDATSTTNGILVTLSLFFSTLSAVVILPINAVLHLGAWLLHLVA